MRKQDKKNREKIERRIKEEIAQGEAMEENSLRGPVAPLKDVEVVASKIQDKNIRVEAVLALSIPEPAKTFDLPEHTKKEIVQGDPISASPTLRDMPSSLMPVAGSTTKLIRFPKPPNIRQRRNSVGSQ